MTGTDTVPIALACVNHYLDRPSLGHYKTLVLLASVVNRCSKNDVHLV